MSSKEVYLQNCETVYNIYNIPKKDRGGKYTIHHTPMKSDYKFGLIPDDGTVDDISHLCPLKKEEHEQLHRKLEYMHEDWGCIPRLKRRFGR